MQQSLFKKGQFTPWIEAIAGGTERTPRSPDGQSHINSYTYSYAI